MITFKEHVITNTPTHNTPASIGRVNVDVAAKARGDGLKLSGGKVRHGAFLCWCEQSINHPVRVGAPDLKFISVIPGDQAHLLGTCYGSLFVLKGEQHGRVAQHRAIGAVQIPAGFGGAVNVSVHVRFLFRKSPGRSSHVHRTGPVPACSTRRPLPRTWNSTR